MASILPYLPAEILEQVINRLETSELCSLRLVCKSLYDKSLHPFGALCTTITTDFSRSSLRSLQRIAKHKVLRDYVQTLLIRKASWDVAGYGIHWFQSTSTCIEQQDSITAQLHHIIAYRLPRCRSFIIQSRDESGTLSFPFTLADAVEVVLQLIAKNGISVESLKLDLCYGTIHPNRIQTKTHLQPASETAWSDLQDLSLCLSSASEVSAWVFLFIIRFATNLRRLTVDLGFDFSNAFMNPLSRSNDLLGLVHLNLKRIATTSAGLHKFIARSQNTLCSLSLECILFPLDDSWVTFLKGLYKSVPRLSEINLCWLSFPTRPCHSHITFPTLSTSTVVPVPGGRNFRLRCCQKSVFGVTYAGPGVDEALTMLADVAVHI